MGWNEDKEFTSNKIMYEATRTLKLTNFYIILVLNLQYLKTPLL